MRFRVDPSQFARTASPLRVAADVAREVEAARDNLKGHVTHAGSEHVERAAEDFLDAWSRGLAGVAERSDTLARMLDLAASSYGDVEQRVHRSGDSGDGS
jgi:hypothetical protein